MLLLLSNAPLGASDGKPIYHLTIVDAAIFADNFWDTSAGLAFWATPEGKAVLQAMFEYRNKMESQTKP